eukprot:TRINITY_DN7430_c0_g1_i1.p4 TRINITY_DN7430_c0_g1~~TRINITY_DN7430_c0_g1_i1.p4  ORF type:complete len:110 (-),score=0.61 TRINITY_DN7430_c0_g1_i1:62-391(-)
MLICKTMRRRSPRPTCAIVQVATHDHVWVLDCMPALSDSDYAQEVGSLPTFEQVFDSRLLNSLTAGKCAYNSLFVYNAIHSRRVRISRRCQSSSAAGTCTDKKSACRRV